jgi:hypothetical protein
VLGLVAATLGLSGSVGLSACGDRANPSEASADVAPPWGSTEAAPKPRPGMVWIPKGALIAGTPPGVVPRVADTEMAGEQVVLEGFFIDIYPHPNEPGALPTTNVTADEAAGLCNAQGKRLCSELELERACKGPDNTIYPYGDEYRRDPCGPGADGRVVPNGFHDACRSAFGVQDTHGSVWVWTSSPWGRGTEGLVTIRGGNSSRGELAGRCANGRGARPDARRVDLGVRCCAGPANTREVSLSVVRGPALRLRVGDDALAKRFDAVIEARPSLEEEASVSPVAGRPGSEETKTFHVERVWTWHPLGNEELLLGGGCSTPPRKRCGLFVARDHDKGLELVALASTDEWQPTLGETDTAREIFVHGGDDVGAFRKRVSYDWGRISISDKQRKKKHKGKFRYE